MHSETPAPQTEQRLAAICSGELSKADMLNQTIDEYREVYLKAKQNFAILVEVRVL